MKALLLVLVAALTPVLALAFDHSHKDLTTVLQSVVSAEGTRTVVDYASLKTRPEVLDRYLGDLERVGREEFDAFTPDEQLAFLINAYNAFTLKLVITHYPVSSIRKIGGITGPWKVKFINLLGEKKHLDDIEHNMIRKMFREPRIHFAVNCASRGCPNLAPVAYEASVLEGQLETATREFLADTSLNRLSTDGRALEVSSIFTWFKKDFTTVHGSLPNFLVQYVPLSPEAKARVLSGETEVKFLDYDWSLNAPAKN